MSEFNGDRRKKAALRVTIGICAAVLVVEVMGGLVFNSLALLSDAGHMFMDTFSLILSLVALHVATLPTDTRRTYGWHRMEVFAALVNGLLLLGASGIILYESVARLFEQVHVHGEGMLVIALVGLAANAVMLLRLRGHAHGDLNLRSAFLHVLSDFAASLGVVIAGAIIALGGPRQADAVVGGLIALAILYGAARVLRDALHILLEGVPKGLALRDVVATIAGVEGVRDIHHFHLWAICSNVVTVSSHILIDPADRHRTDAIIAEINHRLAHRFGITDTTFQLDEVPQTGDQLIFSMAHPEETELYGDRAHNGHHHAEGAD
jgi:cobalt-zinc-cadmium efflux system protein